MVSGSTEVSPGVWEAFAPTVYRNAYPQRNNSGNPIANTGWSTAYALVDLSGTSGDITCSFDYSPFAGEPNQTSYTDPGRSFSFYADFNMYASYTDAQFGGANWAGSVKVTCDKEFAATINMFRRISQNGSITQEPWVATYELLTGGGTEVYCPDQFKNDNSTLNGYNSTIQVINLGQSPIRVTMEGYNSGQTSSTPAWTKSNLAVIQPGAVGGGWLSNTSFSEVPSGFYGSVKLTAVNSDGSSNPILMHANANVFNLTASTIGDGEAVYSCTSN
jgi:hypothetical protein